MSQSDPTDSALAAIASILEQPEIHREPDKPATEERPAVPPPIPAAHTPIEAYQRLSLAIQFRNPPPVG